MSYNTIRTREPITIVVVVDARSFQRLKLSGLAGRSSRSTAAATTVGAVCRRVHHETCAAEEKWPANEWCV